MVVAEAQAMGVPVLTSRVVGASENWGTEQEHLNNVFGARLRITTLKAQNGPGVELLEYLAPRDGRPYPADSRPNDLWHWHTTAETRDLAGLLRNLRPSGSADVDGYPAALVRDPDGHAVKFVGTLDR